MCQSCRKARWNTRAVFKVLPNHVTGGEIQEVKSNLPREIQTLWA